MDGNQFVKRLKACKFFHILSFSTIQSDKVLVLRYGILADFTGVMCAGFAGCGAVTLTVRYIDIE